MVGQSPPCHGEDECQLACTSGWSEESVILEGAPCIWFWYFPPDVYAWIFSEVVVVLSSWPVASSMYVDLNLWIAIKREPLLSICLVANHSGDMEPFGKLEHFHNLVRTARAQNIVVF